MNKRLVTGLLLLFVLAILPVSLAQVPPQYKGNRLYSYENIHSGNKVRTIFYNYGLVGNLSEISGEWPLGTGNEYVGDVTICVGVEYTHPSNDIIHSVVTCRSPRGTDDVSPNGVHWGFEALPGFGAPPDQASDDPGEAGLVAMSHQPETWPSFWPDKQYDDPRDILWEMDTNDPGWAGKWNGYFGKDVTNADQESYWQMDDNADREFRMEYLKDPETGEIVRDEENNPIEMIYYPTEDDTSRGGMGIRVAARGFQWSHFLAEDAIVWQYEITNISDYNYDKVAFGMVVGTLAGGRSDTDDDLAFFDPDNDITYSYDENNGPSRTNGWVPVNDDHDVGWIGYAFLESPGNEFDGIDNDGDYTGNAPILTEAQLREWSEDGIHRNPGSELVLIDYNTYERSVVTMPESGELEYDFRGQTRILYADSLLIEDGYNNFDDNFNGLIDERYVPPSDSVDQRLDHVGYAYIDYFTGAGLNDPMIDEARNDGIDNDGDWDPRTDDVGFDGQAGTQDQGEGNGQPDNGEPHFDKTDIDESDQIGLTSFDYFDIDSASELRLRNDNDMWNRMKPGNIDVVPGRAMDGDFMYGSGYFPLPSGNTQRFSTALFFGEDSVDVFLNKKTVQQIYDSNYNFARPPEKPTVTAVAGDGYVTLYWDDKAEFSEDPSQPVEDKFDFEGYKIYRATDPGFLENYIITDGLGRKVFHKPIEQFDLKDGKAGFFSTGDIGVSFYLGEDSGLQHVWTDSTVENGQQYYYAVTSYDFGNDSTGVFPAETSKYIFVDETGTVKTDQNTVVVTPSPTANGYKAPVEGSAEPIAGSADAFIHVEVVDPTLVLDNKDYEFTFSDPDSLRRAKRYTITRYGAQGGYKTVIRDGSLADRFNSKRVFDMYDTFLDSTYGAGDGLLNVESFFDVVETPVFEGLRAFMLLPRRPARFISAQSYWDLYNAVDEDSMLTYTMSPISYLVDNFVGDSTASDYRVTFYNEVVDTSMELHRGFFANWTAMPIYFKVENLTLGNEPLILFADKTAPEGGEINDGKINNKSEISLLDLYDADSDGDIDTVATWAILFQEVVNEERGLGHIYPPRGGDVLMLSQYNMIATEDVFNFDSESAKVDRDEVDLDRIKVYPNPYLAANVQEPSNPYSSGRGERRVTFNHLPKKCTIRIYTVRGELVDTIEHNESIFDGSENWDLRNQDGLDIAYGIYVYHVDSPWGEHVGKFAVIK
ncbi:hypothetical protein KQI52_00830 [bacterium]|nr:hypothetical protein [bacterium]